MIRPGLASPDVWAIHEDTSRSVFNTLMPHAHWCKHLWHDTTWWVMQIYITCMIHMHDSMTCITHMSGRMLCYMLHLFDRYAWNTEIEVNYTRNLCTEASCTQTLVQHGTPTHRSATWLACMTILTYHATYHICQSTHCHKHCMLVDALVRRYMTMHLWGSIAYWHMPCGMLSAYSIYFSYL